MDELRAMVNAIHEDVQEIRAAVDRIGETINGNGKPGLKTTVALLEARSYRHDRVFLGVTTSLIVALVIWLAGTLYSLNRIEAHSVNPTTEASR